jgi:hypothetical protein
MCALKGISPLWIYAKNDHRCRHPIKFDRPPLGAILADRATLINVIAVPPKSVGAGNRSDDARNGTGDSAL